MAKLDGESTAEIAAPIGRVWALVEDVCRAPEWQAGMKALRAIERDEQQRVSVAEVEVDARVRSLRARIRFDYSQAPAALRWRSEGGDIKSLNGAWELRELPGERTRARYFTEVDLGRLGLVIRGPVVGLLRDQLAGGRARELAEAVERGGIAAG
jgi:ribosome-associated toxin RatA of RatAB toxin-antitoxin module